MAVETGTIESWLRLPTGTRRGGEFLPGFSRSSLFLWLFLVGFVMTLYWLFSCLFYAVSLSKARRIFSSGLFLPENISLAQMASFLKANFRVQIFRFPCTFWQFDHFGTYLIIPPSLHRWILTKTSISQLRCLFLNENALRVFFFTRLWNKHNIGRRRREAAINSLFY